MHKFICTAILTELLLKCCKNPATTERVVGGGKYIQESEINTDLPDTIVDEDISHLQPYYTRKAWNLMEKKGIFPSLVH